MLLFSDVVVVLDLNKKFGRSMDLAKKRHESVDLHTPIHPLPSYLSALFSEISCPCKQMRMKEKIYQQG